MKLTGKLFSFGISLCIMLSACSQKCPKDPQNISTNGCGDFFVYDEISDSSFSNAYITISVDRKNIDLGAEYKTFDIASSPEITSTIEAFNQPYNPYCTDVLPDTSFIQLNAWTLVSGTVQLKIVRDKNDCTSTYVIDCILINAVYKDANNNEIAVSYHHFQNVRVGWYPG